MAIAERIMSASVDSISQDSAANWGDEGPVSQLRPGMEGFFAAGAKEAAKARRLARKVRDVTVVRANGLMSERTAIMQRSHRNGTGK